MKVVSKYQEIEEVASKNALVLVYFSTPDCNVCRVVKPKVKSVVNEVFTRVSMLDVDIANSPELAASYSVFVAPTIILLVDGKEANRWSRSISIDSIVAALNRYKNMLDL